MDYVCYCATKIITTQLCNQVYMGRLVVLACIANPQNCTTEPYYFRDKP